MLYIRGHKIIKGHIGNAPISYVGFGKSGLIKIKSENGGSDYPGNLIAKYTTNTSGVLPTFNNGYQYTVNETELNGIYTVELFSDDDFTSCSFRDKSELLTVDCLKVTDKVTNMGSMFSSCSKLTQLDVSNWDTKNIISMGYMFHNCFQLTQLDVSNWVTNKVTNMQYMFYNCSQLTQLDVSNWVTNKVTNMQYMFYNCSQLTQLDVSNWVTNSATGSINNMFQSCTSLTDFIAPKNINVNISFNYCNNLSHDSLMSIINNLATVTSAQTLTLGATNLAKLNDTEKAIATNKGWTLV